MKKIISLFGVFCVTTISSTSMVSCTSPYRYWSSFQEKIKNGDTFIIEYSISGDSKTISFNSDTIWKKNSTDQNSYFQDKLNNIIDDYNLETKNISNNDLANDEDYMLNGYGSKINNNKINFLNWSISKSSEMWTEWWSQRVYNWIKTNLIQTFYYYYFEMNNNTSKKYYETAVTYVNNYIKTKNCFDQSTNPQLILVRGGKFVGFLTYHTASDTPADSNPSGETSYKTEINRMDDFCYYVKDLLVDQKTYSQSLITDILNSQTNNT